MSGTEKQSAANASITTPLFKRKFRNLILLTWNLPPVIGLSFIVFTDVLSPSQVTGILQTPAEPLYIVGWILFSVWYFPRLVEPIARCAGRFDCHTDNGEQVMKVLRVFPLRFWGIFLVYLALAPASVILSAEYYTDYVAQPIDWFRIQLVALIVSIIVGLPIFFLIYDLFGRALSGVVLRRPYVSLKVKVFMIGALVPLLIDTMLVQYFWTRTGYFEVETFVVWLALEILAIIGSLIFVHSFAQSLSPLQQLIVNTGRQAEQGVSELRPQSTDELGVLSTDFAELICNLKNNERRYRALVESSNSIPWELDLDTWQFTYVGPQAEKVLGYPVEDWYQESFWNDHIYPEDRERAVTFCVSSTERGVDHEFEYRMIAADGRIVWIRDSVNVIVEEGKRTRLQGFMFDITANKESQAALEQSERKFSSVYHSSPVALLISSLEEGRVIEVNKRFEELFGYQQHEIFGKTTSEFNLWQNACDRSLIVKQVRLFGRFANEVRTLLTKEGHKIQCQLAVHPISLDGEECLITVLQDVSERLRIETTIHSLAQSSTVNDYTDFLRNVVKGLAHAYDAQYAFIGILLPDAKQVQTLAVWAGKEFADNFTYDLQGTPCHDVLDLKKELIPKNAWRLYPDDILLKDMGVESYYGSPLISSDNSLMGLISVMDVREMDIQPWVEPVLGMFASRIAAEMERHLTHEELQVHQHHLEDVVKQRTNELRNLNEELEAFSYSVSHDLRAPLRSISGFSQALMEDYAEVLDEDGMDYLQRVCKGVMKMSSLIDDMLNLSRVSRTEIKQQDVDLAEISREVIYELQHGDTDRKVTVSIEEDMQVRGDAKLLRIVMANLIGNAWKYTSNMKQASIQVGKHMEDGMPVFFVRDNGVGFEMKYAKKLFGVFQRLHHQADFEGTGIGLATVKRVITRHGGRVWAQSKPDVGSVFYFSLGSHDTGNDDK